jgi:hypothetical protein
VLDLGQFAFEKLDAFIQGVIILFFHMTAPFACGLFLTKRARQMPAPDLIGGPHLPAA